MKTAYDIMWISPVFANAETAFTNPLPAQIEENIAHVASQNRDADVFLWVDAKRLTSEQMDYLRAFEKRITSGNLYVRDLREIAAYNSLTDNHQHTFFDIPNDAPRAQANSIFWRQVDTARLMAAMQTAREGYDQVIYADADITNLQVTSDNIQKMLQKHGLILCSPLCGVGFENGLFGFSKEHLPLVKKLFGDTLKDTLSSENNGFPALWHWAENTAMPELGISDQKFISFAPKFLYGKEPPLAYEVSAAGRQKTERQR